MYESWLLLFSSAFSPEKQCVTVRDLQNDFAKYQQSAVADSE